MKHYNYAQAGAYFVTICTQHRECMFGDIIDGEMELNGAGLMVQKWWLELRNKFNNIEIDEYVIMPNHMHGIIIIHHNCRGEVISPLSDTDNILKKGGETPPLRNPSLGQIVAYFKYHTTKQINEKRNTPGMPVWQRNYFERVIRNEFELNRIRQYIINNPLQWDIDKENPANTGFGS